IPEAGEEGVRRARHRDSVPAADDKRGHGRAAQAGKQDMTMKKQDLKIRSGEGPEFDCYLVSPQTKSKVPAIVLASAIHGVDKDLRSIADEFASHGYLAAAPDLFWRTTPGPLTRDDPRSSPRGQPRLEKIRTGEQDLKDVLPLLRKQPGFNRKAAGCASGSAGPSGVLGPKRLGYDAGISCHGTQMLDYGGEMEGVRQPVCVIWGDQDHLAPPPVIAAYRDLAARMKNLELHIF